MKKLILFIIMFLMIGLSVFGLIHWKVSTTPDDGSALREDIKYLNEMIDLSLLIYGEDILFPQELEYEKIDSLDSENWQRDNDYVYLIISDLNGTTDFEKEEYLELVAYANKNTNFNFYYIGTDDLDMIKENTLNSNLNDQDMSFGYIIYEGARITHFGVWTQIDQQYIELNPKLLGENIYSAILMIIKTNE